MYKLLTHKNKLYRFYTFFILCFNLINLNPANAGVFRIKNRSYGNVTEQAVVTQIDSAFDTLETQINSKLTNFDTSDYLKGISNSSSIASSGITEDHDYRFKYFYFGLSGGIAADMGSTSLTSLTNGGKIDDFKGVNGNFQLTIGMPAWYFKIPKWKFINPDEMKFYMGYASQNFSQDNYKFAFNSFSFIAQQHFLTNYNFGWGLFNWNGLLVSTGIKYSQLQVLYSQTFSESSQQTISAPPITPDPNLTFNFTNTVSLGAKTNITTIPVDVSSSIKVLYLFNLHGGFGADINMGSSQSIIKAPGQLSGSESSGLLGTFSGDIEFDLGDKASPQVLDARYFFGGSMDFRVFSFGLQYTKAITNNAQGISFQLGAHF